jgi:penicillin-binding protein 1A
MTRARRPRKRAKRRNIRQNIRLYVAHKLRWPWFKNWRARDFLKLGFLCSFWGIVLIAIAAFILSLGLPDIENSVTIEKQPTIVLRDYKGVEFARLGDITHSRLTLKQMSPNLIHAVLAIEDRRFYKHYGVDPIGLARAFWINFRSGKVVQGGSTITQQLAKNLFLTPDRTITRKVKEALLALYLERRYTKDQILAAYLNRAYFGAGAYGVDAAAHTYFNSSARALTVPQAALIAGLLKAPSRYSPDNNPKLALQRTHIVIGAMVDAGYLKDEAKKIRLTQLPKRDYQVGGSFVMRYFADWVIGQVESYIGANSADLVIDTTLDSELQSFAALTVDNILTTQGTAKNISQAAMIVMTPTGDIRAMVGGRDYTTSQYNRAVVAKRQAGSVFKPIIYLTALENGYTPDSNVLDAPIRVGQYMPINFDGKYRGTIRLQDAVANSLNTVAVRVAQDVGITPIKRMAQRLGISDSLTNDLSLALGSSDVRILSMVTAYATLANRGMSVEPFGIQRIRSLQDGKKLYERRSIPATAVLSYQTVADMNQMLQGVVLYGTGQRAMLDRPVAGKTGTSSNYRDAWFIGYTADLVGGVWVGNDNGKPMKQVTGGSVPAEMWHDVMLQANRPYPVRALSTAFVNDTLPYAAQHDTESQPDQDGVFDSILESLLGPKEEKPE